MVMDARYVTFVAQHEVHREIQRRRGETPCKKLAMLYVRTRLLGVAQARALERSLSVPECSGWYRSLVEGDRSPISVAIKVFLGRGSEKDVRRIVSRFERNPTKMENIVAVSIVAQIREVAVDEDAVKKALNKFGKLANYLLFGEPRLEEWFLRDNPETWVVVRSPRIKFRKRRKRRKVDVNVVETASEENEVFSNCSDSEVSEVGK